MINTISRFTGLESAIKNFNDWDHAALLYVNIKEGYFETVVFPNEVSKSMTYLDHDCYSIFGKGDTNQISIGEKRKEYIIDYVKLILEGYEPLQADYKLIDKYPYI